MVTYKLPEYTKEIPSAVRDCERALSLFSNPNHKKTAGEVKKRKRITHRIIQTCSILILGIPLLVLMLLIHLIRIAVTYQTAAIFSLTLLVLLFGIPKAYHAICHYFEKKWEPDWMNQKETLEQIKGQLQAMQNDIEHITEDMKEIQKDKEACMYMAHESYFVIYHPHGQTKELKLPQRICVTEKGKDTYFDYTDYFLFQYGHKVRDYITSRKLH